MTAFTLLRKAVLVAAVLAGPLFARGDDLIADWSFDEGKGDTAHDSSGNGIDLKLNGAQWTPQGKGFAIRFDGIAASLECPDNPLLNLKAALTLEAWVKPEATGWGECHLIGKSSSEYMLNYSNRGMSWWLIASGSYHVGGKLELGKWNHLVATFDGKQRQLWINGLLVASGEASAPAGKGERFSIGSVTGPCFNGSIDNVRVYNKALSAVEIQSRYKIGAAESGDNSAKFERVKLKPYIYPDKGELVVEVDYRGLLPLAKGAKIEVSLNEPSNSTKPLATKLLESLPETGVAEVVLSCSALASGDYSISAVALHERERLAEGKAAVTHANHTHVPDPTKTTVAPVSPPAAAAPFEVRTGVNGGLLLVVNGVEYPFKTRISWPNGGFNALGDVSASEREVSWKVEARTLDGNHLEVIASGEHYTITRRVEVLPTHALIKDTYTNKLDADLGLLIYNELPLATLKVKTSRLAGYESGGRVVDGMYPHYGGASIFVEDDNAGIGILPLDDVFVLQSVLCLDRQKASIATESFALAPRASYTLEWAIYPLGKNTSVSNSAPGGYFDFINTFRKAEGRIGTVQGGASFISFGPMNRRQVPSADFVANRGIRVGIISCLSRTADDPGISAEGIEFIDLPKERELLKHQAAALHARYPGMKVVFHNAHTLYCTNQPERYADSKLINADGKHSASGGAGAYFSREAIDKGYLWYVYYPTPGNSFHDAMMKSVDVMMDEMGMDGVFVDGFLMGYGGRWTYDRWDGHSADIDPKTHTISRKKGSVLLLMQPSMIEYSRKIRDKGGVVIANGSVITRSIANEKYIIFDAECQAGPECHLAPSAMSLALPPFQTEKEIYLDVLDKLRWGVLYMYYNERLNLSHPSLPARCFPITFDEIRPGMVRGRERIITMNSGVYGWPGNDRCLHAVHSFDGRGAPMSNRFVSTSDARGVRTQLDLAENESAVIERIPVTVQSESPVNVLVTRYDASSLTLAVNGNGKATLEMFVGTSYPDKRDGVLTDGGVNPGVAGVGDAYRVVINDDAKLIEERDGTLAIPVTLTGETRVSVQPAVDKAPR